jgi:hypothetical protein
MKNAMPVESQPEESGDKLASPIPMDELSSNPEVSEGKEGDCFLVEGKAYIRSGKLQLEEASVEPEGGDENEPPSEAQNESAFGAGAKTAPPRRHNLKPY